MPLVLGASWLWEGGTGPAVRSPAGLGLVEQVAGVVVAVEVAKAMLDDINNLCGACGYAALCEALNNLICAELFVLTFVVATLYQVI